MKRCFNWFTQRIKTIGYEVIIAFAICVLVSVVVGITWFVSIDKEPATATDYKTLENQMNAVQQNPVLLFKTNCNIKKNDDEITVKFMNDECSMTVEYDKNFKVLSTSKKDNYIFWPFALGIAVFGGVFVFIMLFYILVILLCLFESLFECLWKFILLKFKSIKSKYLSIYMRFIKR